MTASARVRDNARVPRFPRFSTLALSSLFAAGCGSGATAAGDEGEVVAMPDASAGDAAREASAPVDAARDAVSEFPAADADSGELGPPYPIVLAHGFFGWEQFAGSNFVTYFWKVKDHLATLGETEVFTPGVDPFNDSDTRGHQLEDKVKEVLATTHRAKVVIIGHSQGGLDARVVAHDLPDRVAAIVSVSGPHGGSPVADALVGASNNPVVAGILNGFIQVIGPAVWNTVDAQTSLSVSMTQLSSAGVAKFNAKYPLTPSVPFYSIGGRTLLSDGGASCQAAAAPAFITRWNKERDPVNALFLASAALISGNPIAPVANDGLVRVDDAKWGTFLGCLPADHVDQIGQIFGQSPGLGNGFDHLAFYADLVAWLRAKGY